MRRKTFNTKTFQNLTKQKSNNKNMLKILQKNWLHYYWSQIITMTTLLIVILAQCVACQDISQISPKSSNPIVGDQEAAYYSTARISIQSTMGESFLDISAAPQKSLRRSIQHEENETRARVERSASPILNDNFPKSGPNDVHFAADNDKQIAAEAGRYFHYNIKPTGTYDTQSAEQPEQTRARAGKTVQHNIGTTTTSIMPQPFLLKGGLRPLPSGSPINPTSSTAISTAASATAVLAGHNARQNPNPDIQDIITGIVKLLNGNVNVHANTQGIRRPSASRINNRGPPRINEAQPLPIDYEAQKPGTSMRPPPYPFDRPERPFITGVPIPEQIVPLRPGFVSNRPPWHHNKPRPPISTSIGGRRPIPQYKPPMTGPAHAGRPSQETEALLQQQQQQQQQQHQQQQPPQPAISTNEENKVSTDAENDTLEAPQPTDTTYDSEFSNEDINTQYIEVSDQDTDALTASGNVEIEDELKPPPAPPTPITTTQPPPKKDEQLDGKKKPLKTKHNNHQKKKHHNHTDYTTIVETKSVVHTVVGMKSTYVPMSMDSVDNMGLDPTTEEVIFMTANRTPVLESSIESSFAISESSSSSSSSSISTTPISQIESSTSIPVPTSFTSNDNESQTSTTTTTTTTNKTTTTTATTTTTKATTTTEKPSANVPKPTPNLPIQPQPQPSPSSPPQLPAQYQPRPGIVLDDPEFKPGGPRPRPVQLQPHTHIQPTQPHLPPGYGEIFDVTLSAIQGPGSIGGGSQQTINIKPYGGQHYGNKGGSGDIIVSASGDDGFVSIDGKRTYINLFGDPTDPPAGAQYPTTPATRLPQLPGAGIVGSGSGNPVTQSSSGSGGSGYVVPETEIVELQPKKEQDVTLPISTQKQHTTHAAPTRPQYRQRPTQPPVRIDTCIVGDDSTCDQAQHEHCKTENGVSSCHCRPGYSRRKHREPCRKVISFYLGLRVDRIYEHRIVWDNQLLDHNSEPYGQLSYESVRAVDSAMSMTPYSDEFMDAKVNNIYRGDPTLGGSGVYVNLTIKLDESVETLRPNLRSDVQKHLLGVLHRRNNNIGNSVLYVSSPEGAVSSLQDLDECKSPELNDCHSGATCSNTWGSFRCQCDAGLRDPWADQPQRAGRECQACPDAYCNNRGTCSYNDEGAQFCTCDSSHYGAQCEIDGEVLGVAIGASVAAVIIIVLTLVCLILWSRRWQREQKNAMGSPVFGYMNTAPLKSAGLPQAGYQVTLEDRMRWAQIADVMAQTNHYGAEPIGGPTRPSSAMFAYPNLQAMGMGTIGGMSMQSTMQMHQNASMAPPVPLPRRLGLGGRGNGMRTLENSSSSEEEDRADLLGRNFQVPRPKSRSNGSIANQSGIYYDVDYEPSGNGIGNTSVDHLYGSQNQSVSHSSSNHIPGPQGIPMSTYTSGRAPSSYYIK